ncbi:NADH-quinone oxidoreductase subunit N [Mucilaginibacter myungsuensis]|uniref:NADH-quinone oxidoreductase subunit N n=1 Tax=Mucilaginibacter myungsuensis TaxID=649104 RepID=A0A929PXU8_9SPHI|nr:NADH-quinone oxidoreductase subunit N [Mucilaginibacter myungsuensis]MBE9664233.1 NADH-quinone oxidoreductase subunit N [Mucilaginibacter myungsuensis]MDN3599937.1 NADH-quinone oxidoreductase subunit N [Mucilaginibacter myungsuensis]
MHDLLPNIPNLLNDALSSVHFFMPEIYLGVLFLVVLVTGLVFTRNAGAYCRIISVVGMLLVIAQDVIQLYLPANEVKALFSGMLLLHHTPVVFKLVIDVLSILLLIYFAWDKQLRAHKKGLADLFAIAIASILGLHLMVMSINLLSIYLSIEFVSLASYLMVAYKTDQGNSAGAGLKYALFGAAASAVMLYGISLLYAFTGHTDMVVPEFLQNLSKVDPLAVSLALMLVMAGIGFKLSFVPMHFWVPDVYQGAATPVTAFLSTVPKIAAFGMVLHLIAPFVLHPAWHGFDFKLLFSVIGIVTMIAGNFAAVMQKNIKRMLAYSSIGHTGFALIAIVSFNQAAVSALIFYLAVYALANIGALMLASHFANVTGAEDVDGYKGLGFTMPTASVCFVIILISLTGLPVTAGFIGKVVVFQAAYSVYQQTHNVWLMLLMATGALTTVVALFYYIKIPLYLFLKKADNNHEHHVSTPSLLIAACVISFLLVLVGVFPDLLGKWL